MQIRKYSWMFLDLNIWLFLNYCQCSWIFWETQVLYYYAFQKNSSHSDVFIIFCTCELFIINLLSLFTKMLVKCSNVTSDLKCFLKCCFSQHNWCSWILLSTFCMNPDCTSPDHWNVVVTESTDDSGVVKYHWVQVSGPLDKQQIQDEEMSKAMLMLKAPSPGEYRFKYVVGKTSVVCDILLS